MSARHPMLEGFVKGRFSILLCALVLMFLVVPLLPGDQEFIDKAFGVLGLAVLVSCLRAVATSRRFFIFMVLLSLVNLGMGGTEIFGSHETHAFQTAVLAVKLLYFFLVFISIMKYVLDDTPVGQDKVFGAISAYLLGGLLWAVVFTLFYHFDAATFKVPAEWMSTETVNSSWAVYFSFTTLTTLGYGDITPQTGVVQSYAILEAAFGQLFLAVIVARLVALQIIYSQNN